ncbi:glycosyltransferase family 2 protein [Butyrivibrio sp. WCD2001]|uniref:glycosyltransferase family 2 protein n=1 Tax=Butyrivibrio sp. WCD2001 TaxID=1280681 RepID=UPI00040EE658|nr:glycosyltransferase [Butyrivibrio sp. WCD2001]
MEIETNKLVSIIIPVYNVEKYLDECIQSVVSQTYDKIEIIIIDDGSVDSCVDICDAWAGKDSRIEVIHQNHRGVSAARNVGLDRAKGDYICFIDSDDRVTDKYVEDFLTAIEKMDVDIVFCDIDTRRLPDGAAVLGDDRVLSAQEFRQFLYAPNSREYVEMVVIWNKIYRRKLFEKVRFADNKIHEDELLINNFIYDVPKMGYIPAKNYFYRYNSDGITGKKHTYNIEHLNAIEAYEDRINRAIQYNDKGLAEISLKLSLLKMIEFYKNGNDDMKSKVKEKYKYMYSDFSYLFDIKKRLKYRLFMFNPSLHCKLFG